MRSEGSLVLKLDEVRPNRPMQGALKEAIPKLPASPAHTPPARKTVVTYKVTNVVSKSGLQRWGKGVVFFLAVVLPTLIAGVYYAFVASPQYVSEFRFSVRPNAGAGASSSAAVDTMLAMSNSYIVSDYVGSRDAAISLDKTVDLRKLYSSSSADFLSRLSSNASVEELVRYWNSRIHTSYDITTGINVVEVSAFSAKDAQQIALSLKLLCEKLVNDISETARKSQMAFAHLELQRAEDRLKEVRRQETELRTKQRTIDARKEADGKTELVIKLKGELTILQSEYSVLSQYLNAETPKLSVLNKKIAATQQQIDRLQAEVGSGQSAGEDGGTMLDDALVIAKYDQIQTDLDIATKLYQSALTNYEAARAQANSNQIYLATYVQPGLPEIASYPRVIFDTCLVFLAACGIWVVLTLIYYSIRDHV